MLRFSLNIKGPKRSPVDAVQCSFADVQAMPGGVRPVDSEGKVRILVSNDDGIFARGLKTLASRLAAEPDFEVFVVAPDRERSATGHALTLHKPLRAGEYPAFEGHVKSAWWTSGTPSDCVKFAMYCLVENIDLVISGINAGPNLGSEILYSGTVSAAMEGVFLGVPSIAVSMGGEGTRLYEVAADFITELVRRLERGDFGKKLFLNVNVPNLPRHEIAGVAVSKLGLRPYDDHFEKRVDPRGEVYYWLAGEAIEQGEENGTDAWCVANKMISVTPIAFNMVDPDMMIKLASWPQLDETLTAIQRAGSPTRP